MMHNSPITLVNKGGIAATMDKLSIGNNLKYHMKRCLIEIADSIDNPVLAYSGGMDSGYVLRCLSDLKIDKIKVYHGRFQNKGITMAKDSDRAIRYARSLGIEPKIVDMELNSQVFEKAISFGEKYNFTSPIALVQEIWRQNIDGNVIKAGGLFGENPPDSSTPDRYSNQSSSMIRFFSLVPDSNSIDIFYWDLDIINAFITPTFVYKKEINLSPFDMSLRYGNPFNPISFNASLPKWIEFITDYPDMMEIFFKFPTFNKSGNNPELKEFIEYYKSKPVETLYFKVGGKILNEKTAHLIIEGMVKDYVS